ncbi:MAG: hypothetical protein J5U19_15685 [Candidatus Methanoperedens sp.]|nr:hypothetical protein [Candidatus Methanoperedens sp.]
MKVKKCYPSISAYAIRLMPKKFILLTLPKFFDILRDRIMKPAITEKELQALKGRYEIKKN